MVQRTHKLPSNQSSRRDQIVGLGRNVLASYYMPEDGLDFLRIPSVTSRQRVDKWSIPPFSFRILAFAVYFPENILAVAEESGW